MLNLYYIKPMGRKIYSCYKEKETGRNRNKRKQEGMDYGGKAGKRIRCPENFEKTALGIQVDLCVGNPGADSYVFNVLYAHARAFDGISGLQSPFRYSWEPSFSFGP